MTSQHVPQWQRVFVHCGLILAFKACEALLGEGTKLASVVEMTNGDSQLIVLSGHLCEHWERENLSRSESRTESAALQSHQGAVANSSACCNCPSGHH